MIVDLDTGSIADYRRFLAIKSMPVYEFRGRTAWFPDEYAARVGVGPKASAAVEYEPIPGLFDYQRDIARLAIRRRKFAAFVDCVAGETLVDTEHGPRRIDEMTEPTRVWCRDDSGRKTLAYASPSWVNGFAPIYEYVMESGRRVRATAGHRFMTPSGWRRGDELQLGESLLVSDASRPQTSSGCVPSTRGADDRRYERTVPDSTGRCSAYHRRDDARLPSGRDSGRSSTPSQADAHARSLRRSHSGGPERGSGYSRRHRPDGLLSMNHFGSPALTTAGVGEFRPLAFCSTCTGESIRISRPVRGGTIPGPQALEPHPSGGSPISDVRSDSLGFSWDTLVAIHYIRDDVFYDIEVPGPANYIADGVVSHNCGLGKTLIALEFARHVAAVESGRKVLILTPLMVVDQFAGEAERFYGDALPVERIASRDLAAWSASPGGGVGICNYEGLTDEMDRGNLAALVCDESSIMKSAYGKHARQLLRVGAGLDWKLCLTGTPAPNDRIEFANHAVFLDAFPTVNSFLAKFFINRGETANRWEIKPHAVGAFYRALSHWSIFLSDPATYGWKDNASGIPPLEVHVHDVEMTDEQHRAVWDATGQWFAASAGGVASRQKLGQIAKGRHKGEDVATLKPEYIKALVDSWPDSTVVWCIYNDEQDRMAAMFPDAASIDGSTPHAERMRLLDDFKAGRRKVLISKAKVLGYGLNLQVATRHVFSGLQDSYESYYQCVKRSNRYGSTSTLHVHIPVTDVERPMIETVLAKADRIDHDTRIQEAMFRDNGGDFRWDS